MSKYGLHSKLKAIDGGRDKLIQILLEASKLVSAAKGCNLYLISKDRTDNNAVWVTEVWDSKEDHDASLNLESVKKSITSAMPLISGKPERGQELEIVGGKEIN